LLLCTTRSFLQPPSEEVVYQRHASSYSLKKPFGCWGGIGDSTMRKLYLCAIIMAMSVTSNAQTSHKTISGGLSVTPKSLTYDNKACVVSVSDDGEVSVYDDDLELIRSFTLHQEKYPVEHETQERKAEVEATFHVGENWYLWETGEDWIGTWEQAKDLFADSISNGVLEEKIHSQFWPTKESAYWKMEKYGKQHPRYYYQWNAEDGTISCVSVSYREAAYTGDWETINKEELNYGYGGVDRVSMYDYDNNSYPDEPIVFTQTLFNTDEKFEYIESMYEATEVIYEYDRDYDGEPDQREIYHGWKSVGFRIMSEDGKVLQTISCDDASSNDRCIYKLNDKLYLVMYNYDAEETVFYKIDQQTTSVNRVKAMPASAKLIYSLDGCQQPTMQRGVNIVRDGDGAVRKIMKK
ncbi:MAG: hypothetical protein K2H04_07570, partial [Bacteroidaceae bacterium]|nr:hypothetical protein [Bacteroidaceae bacterium]